MVVEEHSGNQFPDLQAAQRAAFASLAQGMATTIRTLLAAGVLVIQDGRIIPNPPPKEKHE